MLLLILIGGNMKNVMSGNDLRNEFLKDEDEILRLKKTISKRYNNDIYLEWNNIDFINWLIPDRDGSIDDGNNIFHLIDNSNDHLINKLRDQSIPLHDNYYIRISILKNTFNESKLHYWSINICYGFTFNYICMTKDECIAIKNMLLSKDGVLMSLGPIRDNYMYCDDIIVQNEIEFKTNDDWHGNYVKENGDQYIIATYTKYSYNIPIYKITLTGNDDYAREKTYIRKEDIDKDWDMLKSLEYVNKDSLPGSTVI